MTESIEVPLDTPEKQPDIVESQASEGIEAVLEDLPPPKTKPKPKGRPKGAVNKGPSKPRAKKVNLQEEPVTKG